MTVGEVAPATTVSVVICAYTMERWEALVAAVQSSSEQSLAPTEVLVIIDHNDELLARATEAFPAALVFANEGKKGLSGARNTGVMKSCGEILAFLDDDAYADPQWLERLAAVMNVPEVAGAGGWIIPHWEGTPALWFPKTFYWILGCSYAGLPTTNARIRNPIGASMAVRRRVFASVGGFTDGIGRIGQVPLGCEETELCIRYTARFPNDYFVLAHDAVVHHRVPASRLTWHYFWTRCWAEGLSKAAVVSLVGSDVGLAAERRHVMRSLPRELWDALRSLPRRPRESAIRAALIVAGASLAVAGVMKGQIWLRKSPLEVVADDVEFARAVGAAGTGSPPHEVRLAE